MKGANVAKKDKQNKIKFINLKNINKAFEEFKVWLNKMDEKYKGNPDVSVICPIAQNDKGLVYGIQVLYSLEDCWIYPETSKEKIYFSIVTNSLSEVKEKVKSFGSDYNFLNASDCWENIWDTYEPYDPYHEPKWTIRREKMKSLDELLPLFEEIKKNI